MELSSEDELRLNVLLANVSAVRIDEHPMIVYGLAEEQEFQVQLHPIGSSQSYLLGVRALLSTAALGSPAHYPKHLRRWAGMGQMINAPLEKLLLLGDPEAIYAVACSQRLTDKLARWVWWAAPTAEIARHMLRNKDVVQGSMGKVLANYLMDYLPFEHAVNDMLDTAQRVLQPGLIDLAARQRLWDMGRRKKAYRIGFLRCCADDFPQRIPAREFAQDVFQVLHDLASKKNTAAQLVIKVYGESGQSFLMACKDALIHATTQEEVSIVLNILGEYFALLRCSSEGFQNMNQLPQCSDTHLLSKLQIAGMPDVLRISSLLAELRSMVILAHASDRLVTPVFARTDATGSVMRKQIEPIMQPLLRHIDMLCGTTR